MRINKSDIIYAAQNATQYFLPRKDIVDVWYFTRFKNVGDLVGPYLIEKLTGKTVRKNIFGINKHFLSVGSILDQVTENSHIWGSGFISSKQKMNCRPESISLVRGKLSKSKVMHLVRGTTIEVGDPALMLPLFYQPKVKNKYVLGVVLHYAEKSFLDSISLNPKVKIIDVQQDVEGFIDDILECESIISSSLHGLIFADAYGIPNHWVKITNVLSGDDFKFADYYSVLYGSKEKSPIILSPDMLDDLIGYVDACSTHDCTIISTQIKNSFQLYE